MLNILDPRPVSLDDQLAAIAAAKAEGKVTVGLEVTVPALAQALDVNIDPQHSGGDSTLSCIKAVAAGALQFAYAQGSAQGSSFAFFTVRPDLDSFGAYVVAQWLMQCGEYFLHDCRDRIHPDAFGRIEAIHHADCSRTDNWMPRELFSGTTPGYEHNEPLGAIAKAVADFKVPVEQRVEWLESWLESGQEPGSYRAQWESEREQIKSALESGETKVGVFACDFETGTNWRTVEQLNLGGHDRAGYAVVESKLRAATSIGYSKAPVLVCYNPEFPMGDKKGLKYSICQYSQGYINLVAVLAELKALEPGWGGSDVFIGSPQGDPSTLSLDTVAAIVQKHLV